MTSDSSSSEGLPLSPAAQATLTIADGDLAFVRKRYYRDAYINEMKRNANLSDQLHVQQRVIGELRLQVHQMVNLLRQYDIELPSEPATPPITSVDLLPDETPDSREHRMALLRIVAQSQTAIKVFSAQLKQHTERLSPVRRGRQVKRPVYSDEEGDTTIVINNKRTKR